MQNNSVSQSLPLAFFLMIGGVFLVATMDTIAKLLSTNVPLGQIVWGRFFFHTLLMMPVCLLSTKNFTSIFKQNWKGHIVRGALIVLSTVFFFVAIKKNPIPDTIAIFFAEPIFVMFLAIFFLKEKLRLHRILAAFIAFGGILVVLRPGSGVYHFSILFALCSGLAFAGYIIATRISTFRDSPLVTAWMAAMVALVFSTPWAFVVWKNPSVQEWFLLLLIGALAASGHWAITFACQLADASIVAIFHYSEIIATTIISYLVFQHIPDGWVWVGFLLIMGSKVGVTILELRKKNCKPSKNF